MAASGPGAGARSARTGRWTIEAPVRRGRPSPSIGNRVGLLPTALGDGGDLLLPPRLLAGPGHAAKGNYLVACNEISKQVIGNDFAKSELAEASPGE